MARRLHSSYGHLSKQGATKTLVSVCPPLKTDQQGVRHFEKLLGEHDLLQETSQINAHQNQRLGSHSVLQLVSVDRLTVRGLTSYDVSGIKLVDFGIQDAVQI